jgi:hypothetical protein
MTYDEILRFMQEYFPIYTEYAQLPETCHRMDDFYAPDLVFTVYVGRPEPVVFPSRDAFLAFDCSHPSSYERLTPLHMSIDERQQTVFCIVRFEYVDRATEEVLLEEDGAAKYQLALDADGRIKITSIVFFPQRLAPGAMTGTDVFRRDA